MADSWELQEFCYLNTSKNFMRWVSTCDHGGRVVWFEFAPRGVALQCAHVIKEIQVIPLSSSGVLEDVFSLNLNIGEHSMVYLVAPVWDLALFPRPLRVPLLIPAGKSFRLQLWNYSKDRPGVTKEFLIAVRGVRLERISTQILFRGGEPHERGSGH